MWPRQKAQDLHELWNTTSRFALFAEDGAGDGGGSGGNGAGGANGAGAGDGGAAGDGGGTPGPNWEGFTSSLEALNTNLDGGLNTLINEVRTLRPAPAPEPTPDLDSLSQSELAAHIIGAVTRAVEAKFGEQLAPVVTTVNGLQAAISSREINEQVDKLKSNKDFNDWKPVMLALAREPKYQTLDVADLYALARAKNPARVAELDKKYATPAEPPKPRWGGLTHGAPSSAVNGTPTPAVNGRDASLEAYKEVQARHSEVLRVLEN